ncbi:MAG TPA: hypothetical protein VIY51_22090 [Xanthobacteraceae bacterium]
MASFVNAALGAMVATAFWTLLGLAISRHLLPRPLAIGAAPVLGWAVHSAVTLPLLILIGFSPLAVIGIGALCGAVSGGSLMARAASNDAEPASKVPAWAFAAAALLALAPAVAILPKFSADGAYLAAPIFDHSKIAIIDAMTRQGLPPVNPIFGESGAAGHLAYYYLWHFSAAQLALPLGVSGWEADIALTWFTAFSSLALMMGLAVWLSGRSGAAIVVVLLAAAASLRAVVDGIFGSYTLSPFLSYPTGFAGWLFQAAWAPQHLMSASCVVTAMLLIARYAHRPTLPLLLALVLTVVAGFESSTYVGGVTFAIAAVAAVPVLFAAIDRARWLHFALALTAAAGFAICIAAPFLLDQFAAVAARGNGSSVIVHQFDVLGEMFPPLLRRVLDLPAYWLIELPIEFPAAYVAGAVALVALLRSAVPAPEKTLIAAFACLAGAGLVASWLLVSTVGYNNDLGLRAVLPAAMILIVAAAAGMMRSPRRALIAALGLGGLMLSLPDTAAIIRSNIAGGPVPDAKLFAQAPELWDRVRRYASPTVRVANNPFFLQDLTPWPVNMSWALLANRSSCFAGSALAVAFAPLPPDRRGTIDAQFIRVFDGAGAAGDVHDMAEKYRCDVVVVVAQDKAWDHDPFASSPDYRLAESRDDRWRIYVATRPSP